MKPKWFNLPELPENPEYYYRNPSSFRIQAADKDVITYYKFYLPGMEIIADHYRQKYNIDLRITDFCGELSEEERYSDDYDPFLYRFSELKKILDVTEFAKPIGFVLFITDGHAIPVLTSADASGNKHMIIFDSVYQKDESKYYPIAKMFPEFKVFLNEGPRQADGYSCDTDAIVILKDALRTNELIDLVSKHATRLAIGDKAKVVSADEESASHVPENLYLFPMPEQLLKTAQSKTYMQQLNPDLKCELVTAKSKTLGAKREENKANLFYSGAQETVEINDFLYAKNRKYAEMICEKLGRGYVSSAASFPQDHQVDSAAAASASPRSRDVVQLSSPRTGNVPTP